MQCKALFVSLATTFLTTVATLTVSIVPSFSKSKSSEAKPNQVTFFCRKVFDPASNSMIPATVAWIPENQSHVRFIGWKSEYFESNGKSPEKRCEEVTQKFNNLYSQHHLNYLSSGKVNNSSVICGLANQGETCNAQNQLFTLKPSSNPEIVLQQLLEMTEGKASNMFLQNSSQRIYVSVQDFFKNPPKIAIIKLK